ncbi:hypothetical protein AVEN_90406-1 [Araneus ventricosus]|uniref:Uncharacterized protein n=1 Tax=Araneus ventricosus TaxID=182803 RepID=A0A4Y2GKC4_ARAVE|nr:hypothetical protein AVEN_90406-1 [Araneus ventricosus]
MKIGVNEAFGMMHADENTVSNSNRVELRHDRSANDARERDLMEHKTSKEFSSPSHSLAFCSLPLVSPTTGLHQPLTSTYVVMFRWTSLFFNSFGADPYITCDKRMVASNFRANSRSQFTSKTIPMNVTADETLKSFPMDQRSYHSASSSLLARTADRTPKTFALQGDPSRSTRAKSINIPSVIQTLSLYSLPRQVVTSHGII